jgi:UDP-N-acetylmuramoyl-tripeptide--D-alanyl-D-alanine ligase
MQSWDALRVASAAGADLVHERDGGGGPDRVTIDSRTAGPGALFVGLPGGRVHGGAFAAQAAAAGAWGVLTDREHAAAIDAADGAANTAVLAADDPLAALQRLATAWRRELAASVIGVTGSTGKTSTKDLLLAVLAPHRRTVASRSNFNTEIGLPLEILAAPAGTEVLVLEMGMRGAGQIAELARIAEPDLAVIVSVGPVHLELLGSLEAIAAAKAELIDALAAGATAVVPAHEPLLEPHLRPDLRIVTFGPGGDVRLAAETDDHVEIDAGGERLSLQVPFTQVHLRRNLLAAIAAALALGVVPSGRVAFTPGAGRGRRVELPGGILLIDDCYNANPMSMRAALDDLVAVAARTSAARRVAVLGDMLELGPGAPEFHTEIGAHAAGAADVLVTVGPLAATMADSFGGESYHAADAAAAAELVRSLLREGDVVLVKGSLGVGLRRVCDALTARAVA